MNTAVDFTQRVFPLALLCGALVAGTGCPQLSGDPLDEIRGLHARNQYEESLEGLRTLMDEDPTDPEVNYLLGKTLMHTGEPSLAIWPLRRAMPRARTTRRPMASTAMAAGPSRLRHRGSPGRAVSLPGEVGRRTP